MTAGLAHHMENVLNLADKNAVWRYYDEQFRHLTGSGMAWEATHLELYMKAHLECPSTMSEQATPPGPNSPWQKRHGGLAFVTIAGGNAGKADSASFSTSAI